MTLRFLPSISGNVRKALILTIMFFLILDALFLGLLSGIVDMMLTHLSGAGFLPKNIQYARLPGRPAGYRKFAVVTYFSGDGPSQEIKRMTWPNKLKFGQERGYDMYDANANPTIIKAIDAARSKMHNPRYFKFTALQEVLRGGAATNGKTYDWVLWLDADSIVLNHSKRLEDIADERYDVVLTTGPPDHPQWATVVNSGAFMVRNSEFGQTFVEDALALSQNHCAEFLIDYPDAATPINGWLQACNPDGQFWLWDQGVILALYSFKPPAYRCHIKKTWFRAFNSEFPWYEAGDLIVHFPGRSLDDRKRLIKAFLKYSNFKTGAVDHRYTDVIDPEETLTADLVELEKIFSAVNPTCDSL